jgi:hypothetical protein
MDYTDTNDGAYSGVAPTRQPDDLKVAPDLSSKGSLQRSTNMGIIRREKSENYSVIYNECFQNPELSARSKGIFAYLMTLPDDWKIYKRELSKHFKEGRDALNKAFEELEACGYITKKPERDAGGRLGGWDYTVYESTELLKTRNTDNPLDGKPVTTKYLSSESTNPTKEEGIESSSSTLLSSQDEKIPPIPATNPPYSAEFQLFWDEYPKKRGKGGAWASWKRVRPPAVTAMMALRSQRNSHDWTKDGGQYIPNPQTWINQRRWEDETSPSVDNSGYGKDSAQYG